MQPLSISTPSPAFAPPLPLPSARPENLPPNRPALPPFITPVSASSTSASSSSSSSTAFSPTPYARRLPAPPPPSPQLAATLAALRRAGVVVCVREADARRAHAAAEAVLRGGLSCIELSLAVPSAPSVLRSLAARAPPGALLGAGTVLSCAEVGVAAAASARFTLSPVCDAQVVAASHAAGMPCLPGAATPTELHNAYARCGAHAVKLYPVELAGGVDFVRRVGGPLAHVPVLPMSGVSLRALPEYLDCPNVFAVGASRDIVTPEAVAAEDWEVIERNARAWADVIAQHERFKHPETT